MTTYYTHLTTPAGELLVTGDGEAVTGIHWVSFRRARKVQEDWVESREKFAKLEKQLGEYFAGKRKEFDVELAAAGTDFQKKVWRELAKIGYGVASSYGAIAKKVGKPKAVRAVGLAVGSNPHSIVVPCHRVLSSAGRLTGFAGGLASKKTLLEREKIAWSR